MSGDHNQNQTDSGWRKRQIALDIKAENARELGLDYEPSKTVIEMATEAGLFAGPVFRDGLERLSQPEQEPVAHLWECIGRWSAYLVNNGKQADCAPPSWLIDAVNNATAPPQRKPLTDKAITKVIDSMPKKMKGFGVDWDLYEFARAIEAKPKENT